MDKASVKARVGNGNVTIWFYPDRLIQLQPQLEKAAVTDSKEAIIAILVEVVDTWDVIQYEGGPMMPITYSNLARLPFAFLISLLIALGDKTVKIIGEIP